MLSRQHRAAETVTGTASPDPAARHEAPSSPDGSTPGESPVDRGPLSPAILPHRSLFAAFDQFPSPKGAAVHILHSSTTLFEHFGGGLLYVLGGAGMPPYQIELLGPDGWVQGSSPVPEEGDATGLSDGQGPQRAVHDSLTPVVEIVRFNDQVPNLLQRAERFSNRLDSIIARHAETLELVHVRDPWSAAAALRYAPGRFHLLYEANALPSIELPNAYPSVLPATVTKIEEMERFCIAHADTVVTVSEVLRETLVRTGVDPDRITVIPNGADVPPELPGRPADAPDRYIVYVGALQQWQGVDDLLRAFARLADLDDLHLVICSATRRKRARPFLRFARRLGIDQRVHWKFGLRHNDIGAWLTHAECSVAPLTDCPRNVEQGCCPLKVIESMAAGTPVVASDLPAVRELVVDGEHGRLVRPNRPAELARAVRVLLEYPDQRRAMGARARSHVEHHLTWDRNRERLDAVYRATLLGQIDLLR